MKGFKDKNKKFHPITPKKGIRMKRLTQLQVDEIKKNVLPLDKHALMMMKFHQGHAKRDRFVSPKWNSMTQAERLNALNKAGVFESAMGQKLQSREELSKLSYHQLPHYAKTDLAFHFFNLDREGKVRLARSKEGTKLEGVWFRGNVFKGSDFTADEFEKTKKYAEDVKKPTALRTKVINGKEFSQYYFKPIQVGEFTD